MTIPSDPAYAHKLSLIPNPGLAHRSASSQGQNPVFLPEHVTPVAFGDGEGPSMPIVPGPTQAVHPPIYTPPPALPAVGPGFANPKSYYGK